MRRTLLTICLTFLLSLGIGVAEPVLAQSLGFGLSVSDVAVRTGGGAALDAFAQPTGAYSFRKLKSTYTGAALRLRRTTGGEQDIGFVGTDFDTAAATTFCTATTCFVTTWYDQSGTGRDLVQTTAGNQPALVFNCHGTLPCMQTTVATQQLALVVTPSTGVVSMSAVGMRAIPGTGVCNWFRQNGNGNRITANTGANSWIAAGSSGTITVTANNGIWHAAQAVINGASSVVTIDGVDTTGTITGSTIAGASGIVAGGTSICNFAEAIVWDAYQLTSTERTALGTNQRDYWFPSPLDSFTTPSGAYSFRKLRSAYTGPALRIRRASDNAETDINFLGFVPGLGAPVDVAAMMAHCAATSCFVRTWYDQSGNSRDMVNVTPTQQPLLVFNCLGTLPCMYSNNLLVSLSGPSVTPATGVVSLSTVSMRGITTGICNAIRQNGVNRIAYASASNEIQLISTGTISAPVATGGWNATSGVINGASSRIVNNGAAAVTGSITGSVTVSGHSFVVNVSIPCSFAEAIIWDNVILTPAEQTVLDANQRGFWGF